MAVELKVPELGESITEAMVGAWYKKEGDVVARDEAVVEIETDKTTVELPAPVPGVITKVLAKQGDIVEVGAVIGLMEEQSSPGLTTPKADKAKPAEEAAPAESAETAEKAEKETAEAAPQSEQTPAAEEPSVPEPSEAPAPRGDAAEAAPAPAAPRAERGESAGEARVMPAARRLLAEHGLEASALRATGPGGRLLKEDVERHLAEQGPAKAPPAPEPSKPAPAPSPAPSGGAALAIPSAENARAEEVVPMTFLRRKIAERLVSAQQGAALLTTFNEIDMSSMMALRSEYQPQFKERYGIKLGFMSFFVKAVIDALKLVPEVNAEVRGTDIVYRNYYDVGVAVGGGRGLVVPIIRNAERLSFAEVELKIADLAQRAKNNTLAVEELQGGTFTISNGGIYGSLLSTPIVNPPQSGILGMHAIQERPIAIEGQVVVRPMMYVALTYDHRLIDGREAVTFLKRVKECIEQPARMLLEV